MGNSRLERWAPLTGVVAVALLIAGSIVGGMYDFLPPADRVAEFFTENAARAGIGGYLGALGAFFLIWFAGSVRAALREREGGTGRLSEVAFGGGVAAAVAMAAAFSIMTMAGVRADSEGGISVDGAVALYDLWSGLTGLMLPVSIAVLVGAAGAASLRSGAFPAWFGWLSVLIAVASLSPVGYLGQILGIVWMAVVSIWLTARGAAA